MLTHLGLAGNSSRLVSIEQERSPTLHLITDLAPWQSCLTCCIFLACLSGLRADVDYHETVSKICSPDFAYEPLPRGTSPELADLLARILCVDVAKRYSVEQIAQHPWVVPGGVYTVPASVAPSPRPAKNWETLWPPPPPPGEDFFTSPPSSLGSSAGWRSGKRLRLHIWCVPTWCPLVC